MARSFCFVTYELGPVNRGGAGVVISGLAEALAEAGNTVHVVVDMVRSEADAYRDHVRKTGLTGVHVHTLASLTNPHPLADTIFQAKSVAFREGVYELARRFPLDVVEFFEYAGPAFETVTRRASGDALAGTTVAVRIHGSLRAIDQAVGVDRATGERHAMYRMEDWGLRLADVVIAPSDRIADQYAAVHGFDRARAVVIPPPMLQLLRSIEAARNRSLDGNEILFWGKLHPVKGVETLVEAALVVARRRPELRFVLVGGDSNESPSGGSMKEHLLWLIPTELRGMFEFIPHLPRSELATRAARALCAVVPSKSESFCLVAHELAWAGVPLVLSDIPAFEPFREGGEALHFDNTAAGLAIAIDRLVREPDLRRKLAEAGARRSYPSIESLYSELRAPPRVAGGEAAHARREVGSLGVLAGRERTLATVDADLRAILGSRAWRLVRAARHGRDVLLRNRRR